MKILFVIGDSDKSPDRQLADAARKLIGKDAEIILFDGSPLRTYGEIDGVWFFVHDERGGCPESILNFLEKNFSAIEDIPTLASGVGGKEGGMNAVTEIEEFIEERDGRYHSDVDPLCIPLRSKKLDLESDEKLDLLFLVDSFLKYCGLDESDSRKIGLQKVADDYFELVKDRAFETLSMKDGKLCLDGVPLEKTPEIEELTEDYELEEEEILSSLQKKLHR